MKKRELQEKTRQEMSRRGVPRKDDLHSGFKSLQEEAKNTRGGKGARKVSMNSNKKPKEPDRLGGRGLRDERIAKDIRGPDDRRRL